jgi:hypothetical protein
VILKEAKETNRDWLRRTTTNRDHEQSIAIAKSETTVEGSNTVKICDGFVADLAYLAASRPQKDLFIGFTESFKTFL